MCRPGLHPEADGKHSTRKNVVYVGFMDLKKVYDRVNKKALWQALRINDVGGKLFNGIKSVYVNSLACIRVKECERVF